MKSSRPLVVANCWAYVVSYCYEKSLNPTEVIHVYPLEEMRDTWDRVKGLSFSTEQIHFQQGISIPSELVDLIRTRVIHANNG